MTVSHDELRRAVAALRDAGFTEEADDFDAVLTAAWTSSSELLGEIGLRIARIQRSHLNDLPLEVGRTFDAMRSDIEKTWPAIGKRR